MDHHNAAPRPQLGCYLLREVHEGRADGALIALSAEQEALIASAAAILAVQGYACRLLRMADGSRFAAQPEAYRKRILPPGLPALAPQAGETAAQLAARMVRTLRSGVIPC